MRPGIAVSTLLALWFAGATAATSDGEYLFNAAGCLACHTSEGGPALAGGRAFTTPYGVFYSPNITPDPDTGIGRWSREQFINALKQGTAPDGKAYYPVFPYTSYRLMTDQDAGKIFDYLQTRAPMPQPNREHDLPWWLSRWLMKPWQWWVLEAPPAAPSDAELARGRYLVDALGHCGECHTPRNLAGISDLGRYLGGTLNGPDDEKVPNITPHRDDGIGKWDADDLGYFLEAGELPNGDYTGGLMTEVIDNGTSKLNDSDRRAIVRYLRSVEPKPGP
jgi:mono/diheme cytochrome c family protein